MKRLLLLLAVALGGLTAVLVAERLLVERSLGPVALGVLAVLTATFLIVLAMYWFYDRHTELVTNIVLAVVSTVVTYLIVDLAAGFILIQRLSPPLVPDPYVHHRMVPNSFSSFRQQDFQYVQRVNNLGLRGQDVEVAKKPGTFRILMMGDSFTMGKGVEDTQTFSVLLQQRLSRQIAACHGPRPVEVINGGVDSYAPILEYVSLSRNLGALAPDLVVINLDASDLIQEQAYRQIAVRDASGNITGVPQAEEASSLTERLREWTEHHMFITRALLYYLLERADYKTFNVRSVVEQANLAVVAHTLAEDPEPRDAQWRDIFDSLARIKAFAESHGARMALSIYPWPHQVSDTAWVPGRYIFMSKDHHPSDKSRETVTAMAAAQQIPLIDMFPAFRSYKGDQELYFKHDMHWTTTGHEVAAQVLEEHLMRTYGSTWCP